MAKTFPSVAGLDHLKGPALLAATANGLLALLFVVGAYTLIEHHVDFPALTFAIAWFAQGIAIAKYLALFVFFILFYRRLVGAEGRSNIGMIALVAASGLVLSAVLDTYLRLRLRWNFAEFLKLLFGVGVVPMLTLSLFLGFIALQSFNLTSAPIRKISGILTAAMGLQAILRMESLIAELMKIRFQAEWSWASWWSFLVRPSIPALESLALAIFFLGIWKSDRRAIQRVCSAPVSVQRWATIRFASLSKLSKILLIMQLLGATSVLAGSVTYVTPYNEIWPLLGRALLLPGSAMAFLALPSRFDRWYGLFDNLLYTVLAVTLNTLAPWLWRSIRFRRQER